MNTMNIKEDSRTEILKCKLEIDDKKIDTVLDTGANRCVISLDTAKRLNIPINRKEITEVTLGTKNTILQVELAAKSH